MPLSPIVQPESQPQWIASRVRTLVSWPHVVLSLLGLGVSAYAWHLHHVIARGGETGCGFTETISCDKVIGSKYGVIAGIPLGVFGLVFFAVMLVVSISTRTDDSARRGARLQRLAVSGVGALSSLGLTYISIAKIGAECPVCFTTHALTFALFGVSLWHVVKARRAAPSRAA